MASKTQRRSPQVATSEDRTMTRTADTNNKEGEDDRTMTRTIDDTEKSPSGKVNPIERETIATTPKKKSLSGNWEVPKWQPKKKSLSGNWEVPKWQVTIEQKVGRTLKKSVSGKKKKSERGNKKRKQQQEQRESISTGPRE